MAAPDPKASQTLQVMPEHWGGDLRRADEMRAACDAFFRSRGMATGAFGMGDVVKRAAQKGLARKAKREKDRR